LAKTHEFKDERLARAIAATFARRKTDIPRQRPDGLTSAFADDPKKRQQWDAFIAEVAVNPGALSDLIEDLASFLMPYAEKARRLGGS
jgi:hypothetical protein